ncbi:hypothetical protein AVO41_05580 [Thiomicrospira sp. WB1]|nr:hypothetical protein AVO41_05580 [Thiomicrospira sp. WB1]
MVLDQIIPQHTPSNLSERFEAEWIGEHTLGSFLLKPSHIPWVVFVPKHPLTPDNAAHIYPLLYELSDWLSEQGLGIHNNIAKLGNVLPYCHIHLVMRTPQDECWPNPIWGQTLTPCLTPDKAQRIDLIRQFLSTHS